MNVEERVIRYCRIDTQSDPSHEDVTPSTEKQFDLARVLKQELEELGLEDVKLDEHCYVYGWLPSNTDHEVPTVGFIAHMDTAPDYSGTGVNPRVIECYDGNDIVLSDDVVMKVSDFPDLPSVKGKRLVVTDGSTLLGADDKAGIAAIMDALQYYHEHPEVKHGRIAIGFTPDEEIGNGAKYFDIEGFGADFAYTMDGGNIDELSDETFNAASVRLTFNGFSIHPGSGKDKLINAASMACEYQSLLPSHMTPEHTEGREGFIHLIGIEGSSAKASSAYIIRDHDRAKLDEKKKLMKDAAAWMNALHGEGSVEIEVMDSYHNMKEVLIERPMAVDTARRAMKELGLAALSDPIRGGTDGAELSLRGLPCPNLGTGGRNCHGRYEYCVVEELQMAAELIKKIIALIEEA
ncbi:MAG: peptidase T [Bulleidia sp.]